jgi:sec-independent protein translocase protein TatA
MFRQIGPFEIVIIVLAVFLLFGAKRMPDAARSLGRSMRIFKSEVKEMRGDDEPKPAAEVPVRPLEGRVETPVERTTAATEPERETQRDAS